MNDPRHCGMCGRTNSQGTCSQGECSFTCLPGFHDLDGDPANGCEYLCIRTNNGVETCDGIDNDCAKLIDEDANLQTDPMNCGTCNHVCVALHATAICVAGACDYDRTIGCEPPFVDITDEILGCEYMCLVSPPGPEACDNLDNDCDGMVDEGAPGGGASCGTTTGECEAGTTQCVAGSIVCVGARGPTGEVCDNKDNDCDGMIDEGYDRTGDPRHCGPNCQVCTITNAIPKCVPGAGGTGECAIAACLPGFVDLDKNVANGCELPCTITGSEVCDGLDNDCDGTPDDNLTPPTGLCATAGACAGTTPACGRGPTGCDQTFRWRCPYGAAAEKDSCGNLLTQETRCDNLDGDCDGTPDDAFPQKGLLCGDNAIGICRRAACRRPWAWPASSARASAGRACRPAPPACAGPAPAW
jgi:hypothetical protein